MVYQERQKKCNCYTNNTIIIQLKVKVCTACAYNREEYNVVGSQVIFNMLRPRVFE